VYTVIRFEAGAQQLADLELLLDSLKQMQPHLFRHKDGRSAHFCCSVFKDGDWFSHCDAMAAFAHEYASVVECARKLGIGVCFDFALEVGDYEGQVYSSLPVKPGLMRTLAEQDVGFTVTVYARVD
jgi:hypothetical protein